MNSRSRLYQRLAGAVLISTLAACATRQVGAPVVQAPGTAAGSTSVAPGTPVPNNAPVVESLPVAPGYYRVKPGDTLYRIALDHGQNYRDIASWNNLSNADQIEVGQVLRVVPPPGQSATPMLPPSASAPVAASGSGAMTPPAAEPTPPPAPLNQSAPAGTSISLVWPAQGKVVGTFNDSTNKGVNIVGTAGEPVVAAAAGKVVYAGNGLRGYGNLIIIKHNGTFLTAYAHNRTLLVKEGDVVSQGQKIAEMGNTDSSQVMLHFEVRRMGKPVDPMSYLPPK